MLSRNSLRARAQQSGSRNTSGYRGAPGHGGGPGSARLNAPVCCVCGRCDLVGPGYHPRRDVIHRVIRRPRWPGPASACVRPWCGAPGDGLISKPTGRGLEHARAALPQPVTASARGCRRGSGRAGARHDSRRRSCRCCPWPRRSLTEQGGGAMPTRPARRVELPPTARAWRNLGQQSTGLFPYRPLAQRRGGAEARSAKMPVIVDRYRTSDSLAIRDGKVTLAFC